MNSARFRPATTCGAMIVAIGLLVSAPATAQRPAPGDLTLPFDVKAVMGFEPDSSTLFVTISNLGPGPSPEIKFRLYRYDQSGSGAGAAVGGTANVKTCPPLKPKGSQQFDFSLKQLGLTPGAYSVFKLNYTAPLNDRDNSNHRPEYKLRG